MTKEFKKIWKLIQEDKEIATKLFLFYDIPEDFNPWLGEKKEEYTGYQWLYQNEEQRLSLIGIDHDVNYIDAIDDEGQLVGLCEGLENLPYEILRYQCRGEYEDWCKKEGIVLDRNHIYHDEDGKLFTHYFDIL